MIRPPEYRYMRIPELGKVSRHLVHLRQPAVIQGRTGRRQFCPLGVGEMGLHAFLPAVRWIVRGTSLVPHEGDQVSLFPFPDGFVDDLLSVILHAVPDKI